MLSFKYKKKKIPENIASTSISWRYYYRTAFSQKKKEHDKTTTDRLAVSPKYICRNKTKTNVGIIVGEQNWNSRNIDNITMI